MSPRSRGRKPTAPDPPLRTWLLPLARRHATSAAPSLGGLAEHDRFSNHDRRACDGLRLDVRPVERLRRGSLWANDLQGMLRRPGNVPLARCRPRGPGLVRHLGCGLRGVCGRRCLQCRGSVPEPHLPRLQRFDGHLSARDADVRVRAQRQLLSELWNRRSLHPRCMRGPVFCRRGDERWWRHQQLRPRWRFVHKRRQREQQLLQRLLQERRLRLQRQRLVPIPVHVECGLLLRFHLRYRAIASNLLLRRWLRVLRLLPVGGRAPADRPMRLTGRRA